MIKCEVIEQFTLGRIKELKNITRVNQANKEKNTLYVGDTFECEKEMVEYLTGNNSKNAVVVKVLEVIPEKEKETKKEEIKEPVKEEIKRKTTRRKRRI